MNVLLVAKLSNQTLTENILSPLLKSSYVDHVYVLRDFPGDMIDGKVTYLSPEKVSESVISGRWWQESATAQNIR